MPNTDDVHVVRIIVAVAIGATVVGIIAAAIGAGDTPNGEHAARTTAPIEPYTLIDSDDPEIISTTLATTLWTDAPSVVISDSAHADDAATAATNMQVPLFIDVKDTDTIPETLDRLSTDEAILVGDARAPPGVSAVGDAEAGRTDDDVPRAEDVQVVAGPEIAPPALTNARIRGADIVRLRDEDPRDEPDVVRSITDHADQPTMVVSASGAVGYSVDSLHRGAAQPGGGYRVFANHRLVALYGHPGSSALGVLGEQPVGESIARVKKLAGQYAEHSQKPVVPALEIVASVALASPGPERTYSNTTSATKLAPWVEAAGEAGVHVILDLQPGRATPLQQAKNYSELLKHPHVGLGIDPEWRLKPGQRPLQQIGSIEVSEINEVSSWLARFTRTHHLPQKPLVVHQFQTQMIRGRAQLNTTHPELAVVIHADGHGAPGAKQSTWKTVRRNAPENLHWGWKNFYDEDTPMFTVDQTWKNVHPHPDLITYQ